jgi:hypothetical protein
VALERLGRSQEARWKRGSDEPVGLVGNITDDPELRYTRSDAGLASITVAVSHRSKHIGQWQDVDDGFLRCTAWRSVAENAGRTPQERNAGVRRRQARPAHVAGRVRQQASAVEIQVISQSARTFSSRPPRSPSPPQRFPRPLRRPPGNPLDPAARSRLRPGVDVLMHVVRTGPAEVCM